MPTSLSILSLLLLWCAVLNVRGPMDTAMLRLPLCNPTWRPDWGIRPWWIFFVFLYLSEQPIVPFITWSVPRSCFSISSDKKMSHRWIWLTSTYRCRMIRISMKIFESVQGPFRVRDYIILSLICNVLYMIPIRNIWEGRCMFCSPNIFMLHSRFWPTQSFLERIFRISSVT